MGRHDWYRNHDWNEEIESEFYARLKRARRKEQYLRIQASILAESHPRVALRLLNDYFATKDLFSLAQAYVDQATAFLALGDVESAFNAFELALVQEAKTMNCFTTASVEYPFQIAVLGQLARYERAMEILGRNPNQLLFPMDFFKWHAAQALILASAEKQAEAREHALAALEAAAAEASGLRYHPNIGVPGTRFRELREKLARLAGEH